MNKPTDYELKCLRCLSVWLRRDLSKLPDQCPKCHSPLWQTQRVLPVTDRRPAARVRTKEST